MMEKEIVYPNPVIHTTHSICSDKEGNFFLFTNLDTGSRSIVKFDRDLNVIDQYEISHETGPHILSLAVASDGSILLYNANGTTSWQPKIDDTTHVTVFGPDFSVVSETFYNDSRQILQSAISGDTITAVIASNAWEYKRIVSFDASFNEIGTSDPLSEIAVTVPAEYTPAGMLTICHPNLFLMGYNYPAAKQPAIMFFVNNSNEIIARYPYDYGYLKDTDGVILVERGFRSDYSGNLYDLSSHEQIRYTIDQLLSQ
jgi:hypothetical protein